MHKCTSAINGMSIYHLPLSTNYYCLSLNETNDARFIFYKTFPGQNTVSHYLGCSGCADFVRTKRKTLKLATAEKIGEGAYVPSIEELFMFLIKANTTCALTGMKGSWAPFPGKREIKSSMTTLM